MIGTIIDLISRDMDDMSRRLADLLFEQQKIRQDTAYWRSHLALDPDIELVGDEIAARLSYGARADRELRMLAEKDFLVETRISECRTELLSLKRRKDTLGEVLARREHARIRAAQRREERNRAQHSAARKAAGEGDGIWR